MTDWYNHFDPSEFIKAKEVQEALLRGEKGKPQETAETANKAGRVLPFPAQVGTKKRKRA
jgi:hypothetical protein